MRCSHPAAVGGFALHKKSTFRGVRTPRLDQAGWLRAKETSRSFLIARRRGGRLNSKTNSSLNLADHSYGFALPGSRFASYGFALPGSRFAPVRSRHGCFAIFSLVATLA